jgi:Tol biopolymer transport system component
LGNNRSATLVATMLFVSACGDTGGPSPVLPDADIAFVNGSDIYTTSLDSGAVPRLVAKDLIGPSWSPDGKLLAALRVGDSPAIFLMNAAGGELHQLTKTDWKDFDLSGPAWRPDGQVITFSTRCHCCNCRLYTDVWQVNIEGTSETLFASQFYADPEWSPDGKKYTLQELDLIFISNSDGTNRFGLAQGCCVDWSPDGSDIAYANNTRIHLVEPTGTNDRILETPAISGYVFGPKWSPDGTRIAFETYGADAFPSQEPYVMNADGSGLIELAPGIQANSSVDWSSDGQYLGFSGFASQTDVDASLSQLYIVRPDGSDLHPITEKGAICCFDWRP